MISKLQDELIGSRMQLLQLQSIAPENPQIPVLRTRVSGLAREIDQQLGSVAGNRRSLSATAASYQRLQLEREFADKRLGAAMSSLQDARAEARRLRILRDGFFRVPARVTLASVHVLPVRRPVGAGASASDTEET